MLWLNFLLTNIHFAISLFGVVTSLITAYVLFNSFRTSKTWPPILRALGFLTLAGYLAIHAWGGVSDSLNTTQSAVRLLAFILIALSFYTDPLQNVPKSALVLPFGISGAFLGTFNIVVLFAAVLRIYKKYSYGMEREFKNLHRGFLLFTLSEVFLSLGFLKNGQNVLLSNLAQDYGLFFILSHMFLFAAFVCVLIYAWSYLRFELFTQIFGSFIISSLVVFVISATVFTFLLVKQMETNSEEALKVDLATFNYSISRLREQGLATAQVIAVSDEIDKSLEDEKKLQEVTDKTMQNSGVDFLVVLDKEGKVLARADGYQATGTSMSGNLVVSEAIKGISKSNLIIREWVNAPLTILEVASPAKFGVVYTGYILDSAFVDGYKNATGLETSIYAGEVKAATTYVAPDGVTRLVGAVQTSSVVKSEVLEKGNTYLGLSSIFQNEYVSAYGPFKNEEGKILGMVFVGLPSNLLFEAVRASVYSTFYVVIFLAVLSFIPAYMFARFIERNQV